MKPRGTYGLMAEFNSATELVEASRKTYAEGYRKMDAYSPFPIHELDEALGITRSKLPWIIFLGGLLGGSAGYGLEYWIHVIYYPLNIGGKPLHSWPNFIPVWLLGASLAAVVGMLALNGLPQPYHPVFNVESFVKGANRDKFFLAIESVDPRFKLEETKKFLSTLTPAAVWEVPN